MERRSIDRVSRRSRRLGNGCSRPRRLPVPRRERADPTAQAFGGAVRSARKARGETLEMVAGRIPNLDAKHLGEIERGWHSPTITTCKRIADALEVPLSQLVADL